MGKQGEKMCDVVSLRDNYFDNVRGRWWSGPVRLELAEG